MVSSQRIIQAQKILEGIHSRDLKLIAKFSRASNERNIEFNKLSTRHIKDLTLVIMLAKFGCGQPEIEKLAAKAKVALIRHHYYLVREEIIKLNGSGFKDDIFSEAVSSLLEVINNHNPFSKRSLVWQLQNAVRKTVQDNVGNYRTLSSQKILSLDEGLNGKPGMIEFIPAEGGVEEEYFNSVLHGSVNYLPLPFQQIIKGIYFIGFSPQEVAEKLGISQHELARLQKRALVKLRDLIGNG